MKKVFIALSALFLFSCSNEDVQLTENAELHSTEPTPKSNFDLKQEFEAFYGASDYLTLAGDIANFVSMANYPGSMDIYGSGDDILVWVNANLSSTTFGTYANAVTKWNDIKTSAKTVVEAHPTFFVAVNGSTTAELNTPAILGIVMPPPPAPPYPVEDVQGCISAYQGCRRAAHNVYTQNCQDADGNLGWIAVALVGYGANIVACRSAYNDCKGSIW